MNTIWIAAYIFNATQEIDAVVAYGNDKDNAVDNAIAYFNKTKREAWDIEVRQNCAAAIGTLMDIMATDGSNKPVQFPLGKDTGYNVAIMEMQEVSQ